MNLVVNVITSYAPRRASQKILLHTEHVQIHDILLSLLFIKILPSKNYDMKLSHIHNRANNKFM